MKFKEQRGNVFVFEVDGKERELHAIGEGFYELSGLLINKNLVIDLELLAGVSGYKRIETAVQMMQILIDRGLV